MQVGGLTTKAFLVSGLVLHAMTTVLVFFTTRYLIRLALPLLPSALTSKDLDEGESTNPGSGLIQAKAARACCD